MIQGPRELAVLAKRRDQLLIADCIDEPLGSELVDRQLQPPACHTHHGRDDVAGVQRESHRVTGQRQFSYQAHHDAVAHFTDGQIVRVLPHQRSNNFRVLAVRFIVSLVRAADD